MGDNFHYELVDQLASGFGALLEEMQELDTENANIEHLLSRMQEQIRGCNCTSSTERDKYTPSTAAQQTLSDKSGLHIECEDTQLHLNKATTLHNKNGAEEISEGTRTSQVLKIEEWAHDVDSNEYKIHKIKFEPDADQTGEERVGHFDRPLKEIRVGESPSRP
ncbi:MAG: hypothetical protein Q9166_000686 [cf. Caloplaca sp. 2 TL-2023]